MRLVATSAEIVNQGSILDAYKFIEQCGRVAYKSEGKITDGSYEPFIRRLIKTGHESVLEHKSITMRLTTDRGTTHALVRHRIASYTQESTIYCDYGKEGSIQLRTPTFITDVNAYVVWFNAMREAEARYMELRAMGIGPGMARDVLPNALKTELIATHNIRSWRHVIRTRAAAGDSQGMHLLMAKVYEALSTDYPLFFEDLGPFPAFERALTLESQYNNMETRYSLFEKEDLE